MLDGQEMVLGTEMVLTPLPRLLLQVHYEVPLTEVHHFFQPPARLMVRWGDEQSCMCPNPACNRKNQEMKIRNCTTLAYDLLDPGVRPAAASPEVVLCSFCYADWISTAQAENAVLCSFHCFDWIGSANQKTINCTTQLLRFHTRIQQVGHKCLTHQTVYPLDLTSPSDLAFCLQLTTSGPGQAKHLHGL